MLETMHPRLIRNVEYTGPTGFLQGAPSPDGVAPRGQVLDKRGEVIDGYRVIEFVGVRVRASGKRDSYWLAECEGCGERGVFTLHRAGKGTIPRQGQHLTIVRELAFYV